MLVFTINTSALSKDNKEDFTSKTDYYYRLPNEDLLNIGVNSIKNNENENAQIAFSVIIKRYQQHPENLLNRKYAIPAYYNLGALYSTHILDYKKAYGYLKTALKIAENDKNDYRLAYIHTALANLYSSQHMVDRELDQRHTFHLIEAANAALKSNNQQAISSIGANLVLAGVTGDSLYNFMPIIEKIENYPFSAEFKEKSKGTLLLIKACRHWINGEHAKAENILTNAISANDLHPFAERYRHLVYIILSHFYTKTGIYDKAVRISKEHLTDAENNGLNEFSLIMTKRLNEIYASIGKTDSAEKYYDRYLHIKDRMALENGLGSVKTLEFLDNIEQINAEIDNVTTKLEEQKHQRITAVAFCAILLIVIICLLIVYYNLRKNHQILFRQNEQMQQRESQHKLLRSQWDKEKKEMLALIEECNNKEKFSQPRKKEPSDSISGKAEDEKEKLIQTYASVLSFMEKSKDIYSNGFTLANLCQAIGLPRQMVSKAINTCFGDSFPQLLNEYRIREVSRLMSEGNSCNLTIEAMAEMAGFKSRTSFISLFKSKTGLTPSEYLKIKRGKKD